MLTKLGPSHSNNLVKPSITKARTAANANNRPHPIRAGPAAAPATDSNTHDIDNAITNNDMAIAASRDGAISYLHNKPTSAPTRPAMSAITANCPNATHDILSMLSSIFIAATKASNRTLIANALGNAPWTFNADIAQSTAANATTITSIMPS